MQIYWCHCCSWDAAVCLLKKKNLVLSRGYHCLKDAVFLHSDLCQKDDLRAWMGPEPALLSILVHPTNPCPLPTDNLLCGVWE